MLITPELSTILIHNCHSTKYWEHKKHNFLLIEHEYIFIDYNRNSEYYKPLEDEFKLAEYYSETIKERLSEFSNYKNR